MEDYKVYLSELKDLIEKFPEGKVDKESFIKAQRNFKNKFNEETFYKDRALYFANQRVDFDVKNALTLILDSYKGALTIDKDEKEAEDIEKSNALVSYKILRDLGDAGYTDESVKLFIDNLNGAVQVVTQRIENDLKQQKHFAIAKLLGNEDGNITVKSSLQFFNENTEIPKEVIDDVENLQKI